MSENSVNLADCINNKVMSHVAMTLYQCHKNVHALSMTRGEYNKVRGWQIPDNENPCDKGYLVVYSRGTDDEYVSWSPKHVFDDGYSSLDEVKGVTSDQEMQKDFEDSGSIYPKVEASHIEEMMKQVSYDAHIVPGTTTTVITAYIPVGVVNFTLCTEIMACVDPRNFNAEKGAKYGIEKAAVSAKNKLWELEGYRLAHKIASAPLSHLDRMKIEFEELVDKTKKLNHFIAHSDKFTALAKDEQERLKEQNDIMWSYVTVLGHRIDEAKLSQPNNKES